MVRRHWRRHPSIRNAANNAYINVSTVGGIGTANLGLAPTASPTFTGDVTISSTSALRLPVGTTAQRSGSAANGDIRYNSTSSSFEGYAGGAWGSIGGGATGAGGDACFYENDLTVTTSYSITANSGAHAVGPLVINSGVTVTVPATSTSLSADHANHYRRRRNNHRRLSWRLA